MSKTHLSISDTEVGNGIIANRGRWSFAGDVSENFVTHIRQSVPYYEDGHRLVCELSSFFLREDSRFLEIGTSTGELLEKVAAANPSLTKTEFVGVDIEPEMIRVAAEHTAKDGRISVYCDDIVTADLGENDLVASYYTIQFIHPKFRQELINQIYASLNWGGGFLVFEKVRAPDARFQDIQSTLYARFKKSQGFSEAEILSKQLSLTGVLEPFSSEANIDMFRRAGFKDITTVFKWTCFEGFICIK